eukprot:SAG22_NODE_11_length_35583_cov_107.128790_4_plen_188_part_00
MRLFRRSPPRALALAAAAVAAAAAGSVQVASADESPGPGPGPGGGLPNCAGCFNATSGGCTVNSLAPAGAADPCPPSTAATCSAANLPYLNESVNAWPTGCLARIEGKGSLACIEPFSCDHEKYANENSTLAECEAEAKRLHTVLRPAKYIGWNGPGAHMPGSSTVPSSSASSPAAARGAGSGTTTS